jgi:tetratricopeptide (TPR) repeat protein
MEINQQIGDPRNESMWPATLAWVARARGQYQEAIELARRAIRLASEVGHQEFMAWGAQQLGWTLLEAFAFSAAVEQLELSLDAASQAGGRIEIIRAACLLALARFRSGDRERALAEADSAQRLLSEIRTPPGRRYLQGADGPIALAKLFLEVGQLDRAIELVDPIRNAATAAQWHEVAAEAALTIGKVRIQQGDLEQAREALEMAVKCSEQFHLPGTAWQSYAELAAISPRAVRLGRLERARELVEGLSRSIADEDMRRVFEEGANSTLLAEGAR